MATTTAPVQSSILPPDTTSSFARLSNFCGEKTEDFWRIAKDTNSWVQLLLESTEHSSIGLDHFHSGASLAVQGFSVTGTITGFKDTCNSFSDWWNGREITTGQVAGLRPALTDASGTIASSLEAAEFGHMINAVDLTGSLPEIKAGCSGFAAAMFASFAYDDFIAVFIDPISLGDDATNIPENIREQVTNNCSSAISSRNMWKLAKDISKFALCALATATYFMAELAVPSWGFLTLSSIALIAGTYVFSREADIQDQIRPYDPENNSNT